jgi:hypothetical protein
MILLAELLFKTLTFYRWIRSSYLASRVCEEINIDGRGLMKFTDRL